MINGLILLFQNKKKEAIIGSIFFLSFLAYFLILTINAFTNGAILGGDSSQRQYIGENAYGKMYYYGDIVGGKLYGEGMLQIVNKDYTISMSANFNNDTFSDASLEIVDYKNSSKTIISGKFEEDMLSDATMKFEDSEGNMIINSGDFVNGNLNGFGEVYYMLPSLGKVVEKTGNFSDGKLVTITSNTEVSSSVTTQDGN